MGERPFEGGHILAVVRNLSLEYAERGHEGGVVVLEEDGGRGAGVPGGEGVDDIRPDGPDGLHHPYEHQGVEVGEGERAALPEDMVGEPLFLPYGVLPAHGDEMEIDIVTPGEACYQLRYVDV
ncbi:hypothetical protein DSECCO2_500910 [anaerobic digester metagenome]